MKHIKSNIALILLFLLSLKTFGQSNFTPSVPVPTASSLSNLAASAGTVNMQTGSAIINIPLYQGETSIGLVYSASGNRPEIHPGWTGQGWSLASGGGIFRVVKGDYDENYETGGNWDLNCVPHP